MVSSANEPQTITATPESAEGGGITAIRVPEFPKRQCAPRSDRDHHSGATMQLFPSGRQKAAATSTTTPAKLVTPLSGHTEATALAFSHDRCQLAAGSREGIARLWVISSSRPAERSIIRLTGERFQTLAFSPNNRVLALGSGIENGTIWLYDVFEKTPKETAALKGAKGAIHALTFSPDGKLVAGGGEDATLRIWEPTPNFKGDPRALLVGHTRPIRAAVFSPDGRGVATAAQDGTARLWTVSRIRCSERATLPHPADVTALAFGPDSNTLATACLDGLIRLWDLTGVQPKARAELKSNPGVRALVISPEGDVLVSAGGGKKVCKWDPRSGNSLGEWELPASPQCVALTVEGRYLAKGGIEGVVELYRVAEKRT